MLREIEMTPGTGELYWPRVALIQEYEEITDEKHIGPQIRGGKSVCITATLYARYTTVRGATLQ